MVIHRSGFESRVFVWFAIEQTMNLEPIDPETAVELYLAEREAEAAESTIRSHRARLNQFVRWCGEREIDNLNDLTGRKIHEYRLWRRNDGDLKKTTLKTQMDTLRVFVRFLGTSTASTLTCTRKSSHPISNRATTSGT